MTIIYHSDLLNKNFKTEEELNKEEREYKEELRKKEEEELKRKEKEAANRKEVDKLYSELEAAYKNYTKVYAKYCDKVKEIDSNYGKNRAFDALNLNSIVESFLNFFE